MNSNCLKGVMCPKCGNTELFDIEVSAWARTTDEGVEAVYSENEWDEQSRVECRGEGCRHEGELGTFVHPGFYVTFDTVTPESAEVGESHRHGWWDTGELLIEDPMDKPDEPAFLFDPDDFDPEEHEDLDEVIVEWAVSLLKGEGAMHPNCYPADHADWWGTEGGEVLDYETGETIRKSFHFHGFTDEQIEAINKEMSK